MGAGGADAGNAGGQRRAGVLRRGHQRGLPAHADRGGPAQAARAARVHLGQYGAGQPEDDVVGCVPCVQVPQVRQQLSGSVRLPLQPPVRPARAGGSAHHRCRAVQTSGSAGRSGEC